MLPGNFAPRRRVYYYFLFEKKVIKIFADGGYSGKLIDTIRTKVKIEPEIIKRNKLHTFKVLPKRWIDTNRRNSKNYERLNNANVAIIYLSAIRTIQKHF